MDGHLAAWEDAARAADRKWETRIPAIEAGVRKAIQSELGLSSPATLVFASNTHDLLVRVTSALPRRPIRILTSDGEFHSFRRQALRWVEAGEAEVEVIPLLPQATFADRFLARCSEGGFELIFVSHVFYSSGFVFDRVFELAEFAKATGPWVMVDGYHAFMAFPVDLRALEAQLFYLAGGYKYAMAGEGVAFMHAPPGFGQRPAITGWYAAFDGLAEAPGVVSYSVDARRFAGATYDPTSLYRLAAVFDMLSAEQLTTAMISQHATELRTQFLSLTAASLADFVLLNPIEDEAPHARFVALKGLGARTLSAALGRQQVITDVRDDVIRFGFSAYQDSDDVERIGQMIGELNEKT